MAIQHIIALGFYDYFFLATIGFGNFSGAGGGGASGQTMTLLGVE